MECIAKKVNGMTKIIMACTAHAWLIHLPGSPRRHEVLSMEQMKLDTCHVMELMQAFNGQSSKSTPTSHGAMMDKRMYLSLFFCKADAI